MSHAQHPAGGTGYQALPPPPAGRRPRYRGGPGAGRSGRGWLIGLLVLVALVIAAVALYLSTKGNHQATPPTTTTGPTTTTLPPPPPVSSGKASWKLTVPVRDADAVAGPDGLLLVLGGETAAGQSADGVFTLDASTGTLAQVDALPVAEHDGPAVVLGSKVVVIGGSNGAPLSSVQEFPLASPAKSAGIRPATSAGPLPQARQGAAAVTVGPKCYVVGGFDGSRAEPKVLASADAVMWHTVATLPVPVQDAAVAATGGSIYVFGGSGASASKVVTDVQRVDLATGTATVVAQLPKAVRGASAVSSGPFVYIAGGQGADAGPGTNAKVWAFDTRTDKISVAGTLSTPVAYAAATKKAGREWLIGGESSGAAIASAQYFTVPAPATVATTAPSATGAGARTSSTSS